MINTLHKRENTTDIKVEPNEGERTLLCSNRSSMRSPSLDFDVNSPSITDEILVDYLAEIFVDGFLKLKEIEYANEKSSYLLSSIHKGTS